MKIIETVSMGNKKALMLDGTLPKKVWNKVSIDGRIFTPIPVYDLPRCVAIEAEGDFSGKTIEFI